MVPPPWAVALILYRSVPRVIPHAIAAPRQTSDIFMLFIQFRVIRHAEARHGSLAFGPDAP